MNLFWYGETEDISIGHFDSNNQIFVNCFVSHPISPDHDII